MNISKFGAMTPYMTNIMKPQQQHQKLNPAGTHVLDRIKDKIEEGQLYQGEGETAYARQLGLYNDALTNGEFCSYGRSLEDIYRCALEQYDKIENGTDDEETKTMKRAALEDTLKCTVSNKVFYEWARSLRVAGPQEHETNNKTMKEMREFKYHQEIAFIRSAQKLTMNFFEFAKNNKGLDFQAMMAYVNKDSSNDRNINSLSTTEISDFFDYAKETQHTFTQSYEDAAYYKQFFNTVADGSSTDDWRIYWRPSKFSAYA